MATSVNNKKFETVKLVIKPSNDYSVAMPKDIDIKLSGGQSLGLVNSLQLNADVGSISTLTLNTYLKECEVEVLQNQTQLNINILPNKTIWQKIKQNFGFKK
jgi:hypothetical protein